MLSFIMMLLLFEYVVIVCGQPTFGFEYAPGPGILSSLQKRRVEVDQKGAQLYPPCLG